LILTGLAIGVIVAAPVGPVNVLCIQRTLERGFWAGVAAGFGAVLGDGLLAAAAAFGVTAISNLTTDYRTTIQLIGGAILLVFGMRLYFARPRTAPQGSRWAELRRIAETVPDMFRPLMRYRIWRIVPHASVIPQSFFLTVTNPGAILGMFAIFGGLGSLTGGLTSYVEALTLVLAVMGGSLMWWIGLSHIISTVRHKLDEERLQLINQIAGGVLVAFGVLLIGQLMLV
jgi:threonine/homoserine/homoserine lactone efflux protein